MSESTSGSGSVKLVLTVGFVVAMLMVIGFGGVFLIMRYQDDQAKQAAEEEQKRQRAADLGTAAAVAYDHLIGNKRGNSEDAEAFKKAAATMAEAIERKMGRDSSTGFIDSFKEGFQKGPRNRTEAADSSADSPADPGSSEPDASP